MSYICWMCIKYSVSQACGSIFMKFGMWLYFSHIWKTPSPCFPPNNLKFLVPKGVLLTPTIKTRNIFSFKIQIF